MQEDRQVAKAALLLTAATVLCRLVSFGKEAFVASFYGAGAAMDAYSLAVLIPALGTALCLNPVRRAFLTQYPEFGEGSPPRQDAFANVFLISLLLVSTSLALLFSFLTKPLFHVAVPTGNDDVARYLGILAVPAAWTIAATGLVSGASAILNARHRFVYPQLTHLLPTLTTVALVVLYGQAWGPGALVWGLLIGSLCQGLALLGLLMTSGHSLRFVLGGCPDGLRRLWKLSLPFILLDLLVVLNTWVDRAMASTLADGKVSILYWSAMLKDVVSGTFIASLLTVLLPHFSQQVAAGAADDLKRSCALVLRYGAIAMFPVSVLLIVCGPPLFRHVRLGKLDPETAASLAYCLAAYGLGLYGEVASGTLYYALVSLRRVRVLLLLGLFTCFFPNILFNVLLIGPLGEVGLALSTTLVAYTTLGFNYWMVRRAVGIADESRNIRVVVASAAAAGAMAIAGWSTLWGVRHIWPGSPWADMAGSCAAGGVGLAAYAFLMLVSPGCPDARHALAIVRDKALLTARTSFSRWSSRWPRA